MKYPGCRERNEEGVRYLQIGVNRGHRMRILSYHVFLPLAVLRYRGDLIVEDFAPPFGSILMPVLTRRPLIAIVQWLFAEEKSRQYRLPFSRIQGWAVRNKHKFIAVAPAIASKLKSINPAAAVEVISNGVDDAALSAPERPRNGVLFMGRLECRQKGIDLLLEAFSMISADTEANLTIAGDGPDTSLVRDLCARYGITSRVSLVGRVEGEQKYELVGQAEVLCMPSRYEALPIVALEALALGTPILAFNIFGLPEALPSECAELVPAFNVKSYASALLELLDDKRRARRMGEAGREIANKLRWDIIAGKQELAYLQTLTADEEVIEERA